MTLGVKVGETVPPLVSGPAGDRTELARATLRPTVQPIARRRSHWSPTAPDEIDRTKRRRPRPQAPVQVLTKPAGEQNAQLWTRLPSWRPVSITRDEAMVATDTNTLFTIGGETDSAGRRVRTRTLKRPSYDDGTTSAGA